MKYLFLCFCLILCYCKESAPDGGCFDPPKLSKEKLLFNAQGGIDSVVIDDSFWWIEHNNELECNLFSEGITPDYCNSNYCDNKNGIMKIECTWFSVTRISDYKIVVSVNQNETGDERKYDVYLGAGNCSSWFSITQSGE